MVLSVNILTAIVYLLQSGYYGVVRVQSLPMTRTTATSKPDVKQHLALGLDPKDLQYLSSYQQLLQPPAETVNGFSIE